MTDSQNELQKRLTALRDAYAAQLPSKLDAIDRLWAELQQRWDPDQATVLHRAIHSLSGSGATFGFARLSEQAREIEIALKSWLQDQQTPEQAQSQWLAAALGALRQVLVQDNPTQSPPTPTTLIEHQATIKPCIYILEDEAETASSLALQLEHFSYEVAVFSDCQQITAAIAAQLPDAIIADIMLEQGALAGIEAVTEIRERYGADLPVVFLSTREDFDARLRAVRAGGHGYFTKPADIARIVDRLDHLTHRRDPEPYRILVVDDNESLATHYALVLRQAGMTVTTCNEPRQIMETLIDNQPELILMDVYMPDCSGLELAGLIRQQEAFLGIPIMFLSTETDLDKQLTAMRMGGDDFLTKPIADDTLVSSVGIRAERARALATLIDRDSLTGLLKHTKIKEALVNELARAKRQHTELSFAMIDIDHFKQVNDRHGHLTGDRVIKSLARLLRQRLRTTDIVGRYGGEEFAVVLPQCDTQEAAEILNEIRERFQALRFQQGDEEFFVTFSAGLAAYPALKNPEEINAAADKALYESKRQGRNRITVAKTVDG